MAGKWFGKIGYCCCLPLLPQLARNILPTTCEPFAGAQYRLMNVPSLSRCNEHKSCQFEVVYSMYVQGLVPRLREFNIRRLESET